MPSKAEGHHEHASGQERHQTTNSGPHRATSHSAQGNSESKGAAPLSHAPSGTPGTNHYAGAKHDVASHNSGGTEHHVNSAHNISKHEVPSSHGRPAAPTTVTHGATNRPVSSEAHVHIPGPHGLGNSLLSRVKHGVAHFVEDILNDSSVPEQHSGNRHESRDPEFSLNFNLTQVVQEPESQPKARGNPKVSALASGEDASEYEQNSQADNANNGACVYYEGATQEGDPDNESSGGAPENQDNNDDDNTSSKQSSRDNASNEGDSGPDDSVQNGGGSDDNAQSGGDNVSNDDPQGDGDNVSNDDAQSGGDNVSNDDPQGGGDNASVNGSTQGGGNDSSDDDTGTRGGGNAMDND